MNKSKHFVIAVVMTAILLLILGNWVTPAQANTKESGTPVPTDTPNPAVADIPGEAASPEQQEEIKSVIEAYIEIRYRALSVSGGEDFKKNGFGRLMAETPKISLFPISTNL